MPKALIATAAALFVGLSVVACSNDDESTAAPTTTAPTTGSETSTSVSSVDDGAADPSADLPAFMTLPITDVDGVTFTLADFAGTPVFVQNFATWCTTCRNQLPKTNDAAASLGDTAVFLALSVETDLDASDVAAYAADNGFDNIRFAVMTPDMLAAMVEQFDNSAVNPPSTPHFVVGFDLSVGELKTGSTSADDIVSKVSAVA